MSKSPPESDYSKVNIFYPVIGYTGMVHSDYMMSTINLLLLCRQKNIKLGMRSIWFESLISRARNASVAFMLAKEYTHLLFVDTDVSFNAHDILKLIDEQKEVVVGVYPKKYWSPTKDGRPRIVRKLSRTMATFSHRFFD